MSDGGAVPEGFSVCVVTDDVAIAAVLGCTLAATGLRHLTASAGSPDAILAAAPLLLILDDDCMAESGSADLVEQLRAEGYHQPVILCVSAHPDPVMARRLAVTGVVELRKPLETLVLMERVRATLAGAAKA